MKSSVTKPGYIYSMTSNDKDYKIGLSANPLRRLKQFQTSHPNLRLVHYLPVDDMYRAEKVIHSILAPYHLTKEWFHLTNKKEYDIIFGNIEVSELEQKQLESLGLRAANK